MHWTLITTYAEGNMDVKGYWKWVTEYPVYIKPHHDLMVTSYELFIGHYKFMMRFFLNLWVRLTAVSNAITMATVDAVALGGSGDLTRGAFPLVRAAPALAPAGEKKIWTFEYQSAD